MFVMQSEWTKTLEWLNVQKQDDRNESIKGADMEWPLKKTRREQYALKVTHRHFIRNKDEIICLTASDSSYDIRTEKFGLMKRSL